VITFHLREGNVVEALRQLADLRELMFTELGVPLSSYAEALVNLAGSGGTRLGYQPRLSSSK
jgi:hypothetical protein